MPPSAFAGRYFSSLLGELVFGKTVDVDWRKTDKYGRIIGKVIVGSQDANLSQLQSGLAWHYKAYESEQSIADREATPMLNRAPV